MHMETNEEINNISTSTCTSTSIPKFKSISKYLYIHIGRRDKVILTCSRSMAPVSGNAVGYGNGTNVCVQFPLYKCIGFLHTKPVHQSFGHPSNFLRNQSPSTICENSCPTLSRSAIHLHVRDVPNHV